MKIKVLSIILTSLVVFYIAIFIASAKICDLIPNNLFIAKIIVYTFFIYLSVDIVSFLSVYILFFKKNYKKSKYI